MKDCNRQPWTRLQKLAAIAGAALLTTLSAPVASASLSPAPEISPETESVNVSISQLPTGDFCPSDFRAAMAAIVDRPQFASANWGIVVQSLGEDVPLYSHNAEAMLIPASNVKLLTTAAALRIVSERNPQALPTFWEEIEVINRNSNNARADALLRNIGGQQAVRRALEPLGVSPTGYVQVDGSGLSRNNKAKPSTFVALLKAMHDTQEGELFYDSLPVSGVNGTLRNRFKNTPVQGKVHAKTGTLRGVRALSGYVETAEYGTVVFSIVVNQPGQSGSVMLGAIDEMVLQMSRVESCD